MVQDDPYRLAHGIDAVLDEIRKNAGILHDADVVAVRVDLLVEKTFTFD